MNKITILLPTSLLLFSVCQNQQKAEKEQTKPNIIYILADDLGYGELGSYGQTKIETPIDYTIKKREMKTDKTFSKMEIVIKQK